MPREIEGQYWSPDKPSGSAEPQEESLSPEIEGTELMLLRDIAQLTGYKRQTLSKLAKAGKIYAVRAEKSTWGWGGLLPWMSTIEEVENYRRKALTPSEAGKLGGHPRKQR
ncbi:hypothetical protein IID22_00110 [Patescibacteria group bacterium]|nr:hypothetical protein [Patescibacteria group bacterium]